MDKTLETREVIYQLNALFYGYADKDSWPESAKLFYNRMASVFGKVVISSGLKPEELKRILDSIGNYISRFSEVPMTQR